MLFRLTTVAALSLGAAAIAGPAAAQIFFPQRPAASVPVHRDVDVVGSTSPIASEALPAPGGRNAQTPSFRGQQAAVPQPGGSTYTPDPQYSPTPTPYEGAQSYPTQPGAPAQLVSPEPLLPPVELSAPSAAPMVPAAPSAVAAPGPAVQGARPPGDINAHTQTVSLPAGSLPPEYQPEAGSAKELPPHLRRQEVEYWTKEPAGTIVIDTPNTYLYLVTGEGKAIRYGIGVGREGFTWTGRERITRMAEWPDWFPPSEMIERQPYLPRFMAGGETNPMGARALYLGKTLYRIHGTNQPSTIGTFVSSGCIRLVNDDIADLYQRVKVGTRVVVLPGNPPPPAPQAAVQSPAPATR